MKVLVYENSYFMQGKFELNPRSHYKTAFYYNLKLSMNKRHG